MVLAAALIAVLGTLNPSAGDVSVFLPTEQAFVAGEVEAPDRPHLFAVYNLAAIFAGAVGALLSGAPEVLAQRTAGTSRPRSAPGSCSTRSPRSSSSSSTGASVGPPPPGRAHRPGPGDRGAPERRALQTSRRTVLELAALFSLDSAGSGFVVTSLLVLWLHLRFDLSAAATGAVFFAAGLLGACSQALAPRLARRFGLIRTMAFTHIPANCLLILAAFAPNGASPSACSSPVPCSRRWTCRPASRSSWRWSRPTSGPRRRA